MTVTAVLVSHGGAQWLPTVLSGLRSQTRPVDRIIAVDTGSKDDSVEQLRSALGSDDVLTTGRGTSFGAAVAMALERLDAAPTTAATTRPDAAPQRHGHARRSDVGEQDDWIWLLHDDSTPDADALDWLLAAAAEHPDAGILGPKLREWPSLRRLLEVGVTITGTGRRETGLERGEYDQGQHDRVRRVLAVNTAGMLVRRSVLERLGGFDEQLPVFGNDLDFGYRAAWAGIDTVVVPPAIVFHVEAAHRGIRRTPLTGRHTDYQERRAALYTLLVNGHRVGWQSIRLVFGTLLRVLGLLLTRAPGQAMDELAALFSLYTRPGAVLAGRRRRKAERTAAPDRVKELLPPWWLPYRHGLDATSDFGSAVAGSAHDVADRRRAAKIEAGELPPPDPDDEDDDFAPESGPLVRFLTSPVALATTAAVLLALWGARAAFGSVAGPALSPAPESVSDWWSLWYQSWHPLALGTDVPAMPYVGLLGLLGSVLGGPEAAVSALLLLAVPLGLWGAWRLLSLLGRLVHPGGAPGWVLLWGSLTWALLPVASGAWGEGRLATVVGAVALPWLAHAALGFADPEPDRRWRAAWRTGLWLAVVTAFIPLAWVVALILVVLVLAAGLVLDRAGISRRSVWGPPVVVLAVVPVLTLPWLAPLLIDGPRSGLLLQAGRLPVASTDWLDLLAGRAAEAGAPLWLGIALLVAAALALIPTATRIPVLMCWVVALAGAISAAALSWVRLDLPSTVTGPGVGLLVICVHAAAVAAVVIGLTGLGGRRGADDRSGWPRLVAGVLVAVIPAVSLGWFLLGDSSQLTDRPESDIPAYMQQSAELGPAHGILVVRGSIEDGLDYEIRRGDGPTVGEDEILALAQEDEEFTGVVQRLLTRPTEAEVSRLADSGIEYLVLPAPADREVAATLDATGELGQASTEDRATRAWRVDQPLSADSLDGHGSPWRTVLLVVQVIALVVVLVLCGPTRRRSREETR